MRKTMTAVLFILLLALPATAAFAQPGTQQGNQSPGDVLAGFLNSAKAKNYDLAMTYFADNASVYDNTGPSFGESARTYSTPSDIRKNFAETAPTDLQILSIQTSGNTGTVVLRSSQVLQSGPGGGPPPGLTYLDFMVTATVVNGKIQTATLDITDQSKAALKAAEAQFGNPGMPRTGNADQNFLPATLVLVALVLVGAGAGLVRRTRTV